MKLYRPGILASRARRVNDAHLRSLPLLSIIEAMPDATVPEMVAALNAAGCRSARGGKVSHNTVTRALARIGREPPIAPRPVSFASSKSLRPRVERFEVFRTPADAFLPLLDYKSDWFTGKGCDPSAGDGRMLAEIVRRGNAGPHYAGDIRHEEETRLRANLPDLTTIEITDYLTNPDLPECDFFITNPPFRLAEQFVRKARTHVRGPIMILQSIAWQGTRRRSEWLRSAGLAAVLNLPRRPRWEVDTGDKVAANIWDFALFVFLPDHTGGTMMDWLVEA